MADTAKPMHADFARWYSAVSIGNDAARRQARWLGLTNIVENADRSLVEGLLRVANGIIRNPPATSTVQVIREAFWNADETFEMKGNDRELQVLAGATLAFLMEQLGEGEGSAAALMATTTCFAGARKPDLPMDLAAIAEVAISSHGEENRKRPSLVGLSSADAPKFDFEKSAALIRQQPTWESVVEAFTQAAESTRSGMRALAQRQAKAHRTFDTFIRVQDEELQMLWWLIGQRSDAYDCPFDRVPVDAQPLVFAKELASCTEFLPGPPSAKAILSRAGLSERKKITVPVAVNAARSDWLQFATDGPDPSPVTMPVHFAIKRQLETGPGDAWIAGWAASTGIDPSRSISALTLGELFYREQLLHQFG